MQGSLQRFYIYLCVTDTALQELLSLQLSSKALFFLAQPFVKQCHVSKSVGIDRANLCYSHLFFSIKLLHTKEKASSLFITKIHHQLMSNTSSVSPKQIICWCQTDHLL
jgi:hypothetical protein